MIFQGFNLVNRTSVLNNVLMGRLHKVPTWRTLLGGPKDDVELAMQSLERAEIVEKAYVRASNLSGPAPTCRHRQGARPATAHHPRRRAGRLTRPADQSRRDEGLAEDQPRARHHDDRQPALPRPRHRLRRPDHRVAPASWYSTVRVPRPMPRCSRTSTAVPHGRRHDGQAGSRPVTVTAPRPRHLAARGCWPLAGRRSLAHTAQSPADDRTATAPTRGRPRRHHRARSGSSPPW